MITPGFSVDAEDWAIPALLTLARALARKADLHIFSQRYPARGVTRFDGLTHHALGGEQRFGLASTNIWLQTSRAIIAQHRRTPFDLLHAFWADEAGFSAVVAGLNIRRPVIVSLGGGELTHLPDIDYGAQRFLVRRLTTGYALSRATMVTAGSRYQLELCRQHGVAKEKLRFAPLGVDTQRFQPNNWKIGRLGEQGGRLGDWEIGNQESAFQPSNLPPSQPSIIQVASLLPVKNQSLLLDTLALVKQTMPNIKLNLVGDGPEKSRLKQLAADLGLQANIEWRGPIPYPQMPKQYRQAHLYLQTSRHESQGMAVLEAMACGLPALGTPVGVAAEVACLPPSSEAAVLAEQVVAVLSDEPGYQDLQQQARRVVAERFSVAVVVNNFLEIYETCILI